MASLWIGHRGKVRDYPGLSPSGDAEAILKAIRGTGTNENTLISILTERLNAQRLLIVKEYETAHGKKLKHFLEGQSHGGSCDSSSSV